MVVDVRRKFTVVNLLLVSALLLISALTVSATVTLGNVLGGSNIPSSTVNGTFTILRGPIVNEEISSDIRNGSIMLAAPFGFEFDTSAQVKVLVNRTAGGGPPAKNINAVVNGTYLTATSITANSITFNVTSMSQAGGPGPAVINSLAWYNVSVRPLFSSAQGNLTIIGSLNGIPNGTPIGFLAVLDTTAPIVTVPASFLREATNGSGTLVTFNASAIDNVDVNITPVCSPVSGSTFALGATPVNCTATDLAGNQGSAVFTVTVVDTTAPSLVGMPSDSTEEATSASGATINYTEPTGIDTVDTSVNISCNPASGSVFALGFTLVTCTATDDFSNSVSANFTLSVEDTTAPTFVGMPSNQTVEATSGSGAVINYSNPTGTDFVDASVSVACAPASGSQFDLGTSLVTCTATDNFGNNASDTFNVTVEDTTAPTLTVQGTNPLTINFGDVYVDAGATSNDVVEGNLTYSIIVTNNVNTSIPGNRTVTYFVQDSAGNNATATRTVNVLVPPSTTTDTIENDGGNSNRQRSSFYTAPTGSSAPSLTTRSLEEPSLETESSESLISESNRVESEPLAGATESKETGLEDITGATVIEVEGSNRNVLLVLALLFGGFYFYRGHYSK